MTIKVTFPDGAARDYARGTTGTTVVEGISKSLAKKTVAMRWNGVLSRSFAIALEADGKIEFVTRDSGSKDVLELIRHDAAHVLAEAVQELWPTTQVTIGPVIENGFYYDFKRDEPFSEEDFPAIEKKMAEIIERGAAFTKEVWTRDQAKAFFNAPRARTSRSNWSTPFRPTSRSRCTSRASGSTSAAARICGPSRMSAWRSS